MFRTFWQNLSKTQKIIAVIFIQGIIVIIFLSILKISLQNKHHVVTNNDVIATDSSGMPDAERFLYENALWEVISANAPKAQESIIKDAVIREGSYSEIVDKETGTVSANFLVDIDSIEQTYRVYVGWSKEEPYTVAPIIDCPLPSESKYPQSVCRGTYRDTYDLSLYLPYREGTTQEGIAPDFGISYDEDDKTITIEVSRCDPEGNKDRANAYLQTIPIDLSGYKKIYYTNSIDVVCKGES